MSYRHQYVYTTLNINRPYKLNLLFRMGMIA